MGNVISLADWKGRKQNQKVLTKEEIILGLQNEMSEQYAIGDWFCGIRIGGYLSTMELNAKVELYEIESDRVEAHMLVGNQGLVLLRYNLCNNLLSCVVSDKVPKEIKKDIAQLCEASRSKN